MSNTVSPELAKHLQRGSQHLQSGRFEEAAKAFARALKLRPDLAEVHAMHADALLRAGKAGEALPSAERALRLRPEWGEALMLRGNIEAMLERFADAEASFREAMRALGPTPALQANLGNVLNEQERWPEALEAYDAALAAGDAADLRAKRAHVLHRLGRRDEAEHEWQRVLERDPRSMEALEQLLQFHNSRQDAAPMEAICARALAIAPDAAVFHLGQGLARWWQGRHDAALEKYRDAVQLAARAGDGEMCREANHNLAVALLRLGRYAEAWPAWHERPLRVRWKRAWPGLLEDRSRLARESLRVRIYTDQGLGDQLFFLRFVPALRAQGHRLSFRTHPKLISFLRGNELFDAIGPVDEPDPQPCDVELLNSDLGWAAAATTAPPSLQYRVEPERREALAARLRAFGPPPYVGVTWRAGLMGEEQTAWGDVFWTKQIPVAELGAVLRPLPCRVIILQRRPESPDVEQFGRALGRDALDLREVNEDLRDALALLDLLDEYVGVSNTNMHLLAGLPGRGARVMVLSPPEWRWATNGPGSVWFPGFRLYRQGGDQGWSAPLAELGRGLSAKYL